ncbi:acyl-CoA dehydrogenase family protein [Haloarcula nitratireducens]|uniref:Acyl-CoA dehydrogenase family protein n=1 Tax=Haloarcula nitratireducens TaxID=2487749 RepID=A0AAW4PIU2_9EURY|nr:acyl-CoA dehydrogenase family protein [Halomicroarcula nitratireducens]MBX0297568.1 acyl-CoA dehydrogenase family protein [Halomicroarcula nitratireducens]
MSCTVDDRKQVRRAARAIRDSVPTIAVDVVAPNASRHDAWTLDTVLRDRESVPPEVLRELVLAGLTLQPVPSQAGYQHVVATI